MPVIPETFTKILEEDSGHETGGHYGAETIAFNVAVNDADGGFVADADYIAQKFHEHVLPIPIGMLSARVSCKGLNDGDLIAVDINPDTPLGAITADMAADIDVLPAPAAMIALLEAGTIYVGLRVGLDDGTNIDDLGCIKGWDPVAGTVVTSKKTVNAFVAATPSVVKVTGSMSPSIINGGWYEVIGADIVEHFGESKIGASSIAAGSTVRVRYKMAAGGVACRPRVTLEYLY